MGDRVLFIVHNKSAGDMEVEYSPIIYGHNSGYAAPRLLAKLHERMENRRGDVAYAAARLIGIMHESIPGNLSLGVWNLPEDFRKEAGYLTEMSHGDAGVVLYDCVDGSVECYGSYLIGDSFENLKEGIEA